MVDYSLALEKTESSYDTIAQVYDEFRGTDERFYDVNVKRLWIHLWVLLFGYKADMGMFLDLGCGTGAHSLYLGEAGYKGLGIDLSAKMIEIASKRAREKGIGVDFIKGDITALSLTQKFKCIFSNEVFVHLKDFAVVEKVFNDCYSFLEDGGFFFFQFCTDAWLKKMSGGGQEAFPHFFWKYQGTYDAERHRGIFDYAFDFNDGRRASITLTFHSYEFGQVEKGLRSAGFQDIKFFDADPRVHLKDGKVGKVDFHPVIPDAHAVMCFAMKKAAGN